MSHWGMAPSLTNVDGKKHMTIYAQPGSSESKITVAEKYGH